MSLRDVAVVMTAWRRPYYLARTLASWAAAEGVGELGAFVVALDPSGRRDEMLAVIGDSGLNITTRQNPYQLGVLGNPVESINDTLAWSEGELAFVVAAEEDIIVASDVLRYFEWAKEMCDLPEVLLACAHSQARGSDTQLVRAGTHFAPWVWGTWANRWRGVIYPTWDRDYQSGREDAEYPQGGWDWNLHRRVIPCRGPSPRRPATGGHWLSLTPDVSRSQNIGAAEGIHASPLEFWPTQVPFTSLITVPPGGYLLRGD